MDSKPSIFRAEALEHQKKGSTEEGDVMRISPAWTQVSYLLLVGVLVVGILFCMLGSIHEYATGPALIRIEGQRELAVDTAGLVSQVHVQPGQRVRVGQTLMTFFSQQETGALERIEREFELQLVRFLRDPSDATARQALTSLRAERELAQSRLAQRTLAAPTTGVIGDVRVQAGDYLSPGATAVTLTSEESRVSLLVLLPGYYRPFLRPGMPLRVEVEGFRYAYQELTIDSVGDQVVGPTEVRRFLGAGRGDAFELEGPLVLVRARVSSHSFENDGRTFNYFDGMPARAEVRVRSESILLSLIPGMKGLFHHGG